MQNFPPHHNNANSKEWFMTSFWKKGPESDARSVRRMLGRLFSFNSHLYAGGGGGGVNSNMIASQKKRENLLGST